jgi:tellurite resistance protein TehA-like permease
MVIPKPNQQKPQQNKGSMFARGFRDLGTPQGASLFAAIILCGIASMVLDYIGERFNLPKSIIYTIIIIIIVVVFVVVIFRLSKMNKKAIEKRRKDYQQRLGRKN